VVPAADSVIIAEPEQQIIDVRMNTVVASSDTPEPSSTVDNIIETRTGELNGPSSQVDVPVRFSEKKRLHWAGKTCTLNRLCENFIYINNYLSCE
jgi:tRNA-dihydrouridine synthase 3